MNGLNLSVFVSPDRDWEKTQYKILAGLKEYQSELNKKRVCPALTELINLSSLLEEILKQKASLNYSFPKQIKGFDVQSNSVMYETLECINEDLEFYFDIIDWALPKIKAIIEEGIILYEFVENNININHVGILPIYRDEGYFLVTNPKESKVQVHRFECSLFTSNKEKYRTLKTQFIKGFENSMLDKTPENVKLELMKEFKELPNPATYVCETDIDFPFSETVFPIAKRKLMAKLAA